MEEGMIQTIRVVTPIKIEGAEVITLNLKNEKATSIIITCI